MSQQQDSILARNFSTTLITLRGGKSQAEFARFLGIKHQQTYQNYEAGRIPDGETLHRIATKLGITIDQLLGGITQIQEDTEFLRIIDVFCKTLSAKQLIWIMEQIMEQKVVSDRNTIFWLKVLNERLLSRLEMDEKTQQQKHTG